MNGFLYDLKCQIKELVKEYLSTSELKDSWIERFYAFMEQLNDVIEEWGINCLYDVLLLEEIYSIFEELYDELRLRTDFKKISSEQVENTISLFSSILADEDIKKATALREFAIYNYDKYYQELLCESQKFKESRTAEINKDIWGKMLQEEESILENAKDDFCVEKALLSLSRANKLCINATDEEDSFLDYLNSTNYIEAFSQALRLNILLSEAFPDTLKPQFEAWLKGEDYKNPELIQEDPQAEAKAGEESDAESESLEPEQAQEEEKKHGLSEDELFEKIKGCMLWDEDNDKYADDLARDFLAKIKDKKPKDITDLVRDWKKRGWISPNSAGSPLWKKLHDAGIYKPTVQNWNDQINKK